MKTLEEYNAEMRERYKANDSTGIQCPQCGDELKLTEPGVVLLSYPPQKKVHCNTCKYKNSIT